MVLETSSCRCYRLVLSAELKGVYLLLDLVFGNSTISLTYAPLDVV